MRKKQRYKAKSLFEQGMWNVNTVMMGGLGRDPESGSSSEEGTGGNTIIVRHCSDRVAWADTLRVAPAVEKVLGAIVRHCSDRVAWADTLRVAPAVEKVLGAIVRHCSDRVAWADTLRVAPAVEKVPGAIVRHCSDRVAWADTLRVAPAVEKVLGAIVRHCSDGVETLSSSGQGIRGNSRTLCGPGRHVVPAVKRNCDT